MGWELSGLKRGAHEDLSKEELLVIMGVSSLAI
jgi:hypothetical protein